MCRDGGADPATLINSGFLEPLATHLEALPSDLSPNTPRQAISPFAQLFQRNILSCGKLLCFASCSSPCLPRAVMPEQSSGEP